MTTAPALASDVLRRHAETPRMCLQIHELPEYLGTIRTNAMREGLEAFVVQTRGFPPAIGSLLWAHGELDDIRDSLPLAARPLAPGDVFLVGVRPIDHVGLPGFIVIELVPADET